MRDTQSTTAQEIMQEFWLSLYDAENAPDTRTRDINLLRAWGVFHYALHGAIECEHCKAPVRLAIPLISERQSGESQRFTCLCTHCTFEELKRAERVIIQVGDARVEYANQEALPA